MLDILGSIREEFLISQALECLHISEPQVSQEAISVGGREGGREKGGRGVIVSCPGHCLAFATLCFLQPPSSSSWGLRAGTSGASQDSGVPTGLSRAREGEVAED